MEDVAGAARTLDERCKQLEAVIVETANECTKVDDRISRSKFVIEESTKTLMREYDKLVGKKPEDEASAA